MSEYKNRTIDDATRNAERIKKEFPILIQPSESDKDLILLLERVKEREQQVKTFTHDGATLNKHAMKLEQQLEESAKSIKFLSEQEALLKGNMLRIQKSHADAILVKNTRIKELEQQVKQSNRRRGVYEQTIGIMGVHINQGDIQKARAAYTLGIKQLDDLDEETEENPPSEVSDAVSVCRE